MSGICGILSKIADQSVLQQKITDCTGTMIHRGPDHLLVGINGSVAFGQRTLKLFKDQNDNELPANQNRTIIAVADCELYNYEELKADLYAKKHSLRSNADYEVIPHLYEEYGEDFVHKLRGVFAFAIWDANKNLLLLYRDRIGARPLFYAQCNDSFLFASEMKAILKEGSIVKSINFNAMDHFFSYRLIPEPLTIYNELHKLPAGCYLRFQNNRVEVKRYWDYDYQENHVKSVAEYEERLLELLNEAIKIRLMGNLSYGSYLSGGMDSSSVVSLLSEMTPNPVNTFSIAFKEKGYDESYYQRIMANYCKTNHHEFVVDKESVEELLPKIITFFDQPFGDSSALPSYYLARETKKYVDAVFTGDGGDELLAGYTTYPGMLYSEYYRKIPGIISRSLIPGMLQIAGKVLPVKYAYSVERFQKIVHDANLPFIDRYKNKISWARQDQKDRLYNDDIKRAISSDNHRMIEEFFDKTSGKELLNRVNYTDIRFRFVNSVLAKTERTCIANSLVARNPYLDYKLVEFAATVPPSLKVKGFKTKYLIHRAMRDKLPQEIHTKQKHGFEPPLAIWFKDELEPFVKKMLLAPDSRVLHYFNKKGVEETIGIHKEGKQNLGEHLWGLLTFEVWHRLYIG
ncbi:asparagine synthase (glutamine-hydrolyzing) [candidate division KSB1 bacterium]|nr:asparagine synthase (glutamine-hydrolyzing) [candidate division KSB1 bacterium]